MHFCFALFASAPFALKAANSSGVLFSAARFLLSCQVLNAPVGFFTGAFTVDTMTYNADVLKVVLYSRIVCNCYDGVEDTYFLRTPTHRHRDADTQALFAGSCGSDHRLLDLVRGFGTNLCI